MANKLNLFYENRSGAQLVSWYDHTIPLGTSQPGPGCEAAWRLQPTIAANNYLAGVTHQFGEAQARYLLAGRVQAGPAGPVAPYHIGKF